MNQIKKRAKRREISPERLALLVEIAETLSHRNSLEMVQKRKIIGTVKLCLSKIRLPMQ